LRVASRANPVDPDQMQAVHDTTSGVMPAPSAIREERQKDFALEMFDGYALSPAIASQGYTASAVKQSPGLMLDAMLVRLAGT